MRRIRKMKRGIVLVVVLVVVLLLFISMYLVNSLMRQQHLQVHRYAMGEVAYNLAWAGAEIASRRVFHEVAEKRSGLWFEALCRSPFSSCDFEKNFDAPVFSDLLRDHKEAKLTVRIRLAGFEPLAPKRHGSGALQDPIEKRGRFEIESTCSYRGLIRRVRRSRNIRVIASVLQPFGKFALFLRDPKLIAEKMNVVGYASKDGLFFDAERKKRAWPFVIRSSAEGAGGYEVCTEEGCIQSAKAGLSPQAFLHNGWMFFGGDRRVFLNLTMGNGLKNRDEEQFLLRRVPYVRPSPVFGAKIEEKVHLFGVAHGIWDMPMYSRLGRRIRDSETDAWIGDRTALLHLSGDARRVTPSLVLGNVHRRYGRFIKLRSTDRPLFTSFVYANEAYYPKVKSLFERLTGGDWASYQRVMARVVEEPYNRSYDFAVSNDETAEDPDGEIRSNKTPIDPKRCLMAAKVKPLLEPLNETNTSFLYPDPEAPGSTAVSVVRIKDRDGRPFFEGSLDGALSCGDLILQRVSWVVDDETFAKRFLREQEGLRPQLRLGGGVFRTGAEVYVKPCEVVRGGLIVAEKDLIVEGPISTVEGQCLSLVSLGGNIRIKGQETIRASLVALEGSLLLEGKSGCDLHGALAMDHWEDPEAILRARRPKKLSWDSSLDVCDPARRIHHYQVAFEDGLKEESLRK